MQGGGNYALTFGENGKKAFRSNFREGQNETDYASGFRRMYNLGQSNITIEQAKEEIRGNKYIQSLSPDQRMAAYYAGQNDAKAQLEAEKSTVKFVKYYSEDAGVVENDAAKKVNKKELASIDKLARSVGAQVIFEEDIENFNGYVELGKIHISLNAENKLAVVAAHEVTHRMQELAPESYRKYRDFVMSTVGVGVVESYQEKLHSKDIYLSDSEVMDEIAADYTKKILSDPKRMQQFVDDALNGKLDTTASIAENRNILQKLFDSIKEFIKKVSDKFSGRKAEQNQAARDAYGVDLETLKQAKNLLQKALKDSAEAVSQLEKQGEKVETTGKKRFSVKMDGKEEVVFERSFAEQVGEVLSKDSDITDGNHVFVCETPSILKQLGFPDLPMLISKGHLRDMNHEEVEGVSKYHGLSESEINKIPFILENPAMVFKTVSEKNPDAICILSNILDGKGRPMLISIKTNGKGKYNEVRLESNFILSAYGKADAQNYLNKIGENSDNVNYINKKRTQEMLKGARLQLPARLSNLRSDIIIHKIDNNVNTQSMQKSENNSQRKNSVKMDEDFIEKHERLTKAYVMLNAELRRLKNEKRTFRQEKIAAVAKKILKDFDFAYDAELLSEQMNGLAEDTKQMIEGKMDFDTFKNKVLEISKDVIETGAKTDSAEYQQSKAMRDYLRTTKITLSEDARNNLGDEYETIRKSTFGRLRLVKEGGTPIDVVYQELSELYPMYFSAETETNASAQLRQIQSVLDGLKSLKDDVFNGYTDEAAEWLSGLIIDKIYNEVFVSGETGKTNVSVDMKAMRNEMADNLQKIMGRERQWREREYNKLQDRYEKKTKAYTEARQKSIKIQQIKLHTERLSKALLNPSERFAVPEDLKKPVAEFLRCIDLESDRMGAKTRGMLRDLAQAYKTIAEQEYEMSMVIDPDLYEHLEAINDDMKDLEVENKKLSDLKLVTLEKLRQSVMAMEASLRNYNQMFIGEKAKQVREVALKIKDEIEAKKDKEYLIGTQKASEFFNFDLAAPWDFFHQLGPTFEEMYQEGIREGENKFINNLNKAIVYIDETLSKFNLEKSTLEGLTAAKEVFNLQNGQQIELKKADVMSLYLLWRQPDARDHIMEGGIKAAKVSEAVRKKITQNGQTVVKLEWKQKAHKKSVRPSLDDVANIINSLTENEKKFAESISDFFVNECAEWGNEVSLQLYGYKKFMKALYYPIVSDRMSIPTVAGESADAQIKNKGFAQKRVKGANNPVIIESIFDVYARHTADMAKYNAFVLPLQDMQRVFNYMQRPALDFVEQTEEGAGSEKGKISVADVKNIQSIGRKSVNDFTAEEFKKAEKLAERYFEEMGEKSPFYRAQFGDWRENDSSKVETVRLKENVEDSRGSVKNRDIAMDIGVSRIGIDHIKVHLHNSELANYITNNLKEITEKAIFLDSFVSEPTGGTKHKNSAMLHSFYVPIEFKGKKSIAKLFVEEFFNEWNDSVQRRVYDLKEIEVFNDADRFGETNSTPLYASNHTSINTVADLFKIVKKNDKSFNPKKEDIINNPDDAFSMKELIATKFGEGANDYFNKLMIDVNGGMKLEYNSNKMAVASSITKKSMMGLNMRVALQQPFSYMRAGILLGDKYLAKAMGKIYCILYLSIFCSYTFFD